MDLILTPSDRDALQAHERIKLDYFEISRTVGPDAPLIYTYRLTVDDARRVFAPEVTR